MYRSWSAIAHWIIASLNVSDFTRFITDMTSTTFGLCESRDSGAEPRKLTFRPADVGVIYIQKGVELLVLEFNVSGQAGEPTVRLFHTSAEADLQLRIRLVQRRRGDLVRLVCLLPRTYRDSSFRSYVPTLHLVVCSRRADSPALQLSGRVSSSRITPSRRGSFCSLALSTCAHSLLAHQRPRSLELSRQSRSNHERQH